MPLFPSEEWFVAVKNQYNENPDLHSGGGGACDTLAGLEIADRFYRIEFAGHECVEAISIVRIYFIVTTRIFRILWMLAPP